MNMNNVLQLVIQKLKIDHIVKKNSFLYTRIICLFRIAVGPDEKFGLDRVWITESFMFRLRDKREMRPDQF